MKKKKLILIQPQKYNELFSSYHNSNKSKKYLPKIPPTFQKEWEITSYTTRTNNFNNRGSYSTNKKNNIFRRNNEIFNALMTHQNSIDNYNKYDFLPFPSLTQRYKKTDEKSKTKKKFGTKKSNFNIIYLNLSQRNNKSKQEYSVEGIDKNQFVNEKIEEINNLKNNKIKEIFLKNDKSKIINDLSKIKKIPIVILNFIAEDIYNNMQLKNKNKNDITNTQTFNNNSLSSCNNIKSNKNMCSFDNINKTIYKDNTFFQYVLNNVKRKIEIITESNKSITILNVMNLINSELSELKLKLENYEKNFLLENSRFTSNNISRISNNDITQSNTFRFKTNNNMKDINDFNNNSGVLGNLIKNDIYAQINEGNKKLIFDNNINVNGRNRNNLIFQNQEIFYSINKEETKGQIKSKNIKKIDIKKYLKNKQNKTSIDSNLDKKINFISKSNNTSPIKIRSKNNFFHNVIPEKKITHSFSEIFLKKNYQKESDFINEVSNLIEKEFYLKKKTEKKKFYNNKKVQSEYIYQNHLKKNDNNKNDKNDKNYSYLDDVKFDYEKYKGNKYEYTREENIITPIKNKNFLEAFSDNHEKKVKLKDKKLKNNYQNIVLNIENINNEKKSKPYLTPKKSSKFINKNNQTDTSSTLNNEQVSSENQEPNLIYFDKNRNKEIIVEIENENIVNKKNKSPKKGKNKNKNRNKDLTSIKSTKNSEKNIFRKSFINNNKNKSKKRHRKNKKEIFLDSINDTNNNNQHFPNKKISKKKYKIKKNFQQGENEDNYKEGGEEEYEEEEGEDYEDEEGEEEEEDEMIENGIIQGSNTQDVKNKNLINKTKKKRRKKDKDSSKSNNKNNLKNESKENNTSLKNENKIKQEIIQQNIETDNNTSINSPEQLPLDSNRYFTEQKNDLVIKKPKRRIEDKKRFLDMIKKKERQSKKSIDEELTENPEYQEIIKEMEKYNVQSKNDLYNVKHLTKDKKPKNSGGGGLLQNVTDNSFFLFDENINDIIKNTLPPGNVKAKNFNKQEELKILGEVAELENLTEAEKSFALTELLDLRNIIIKSKIINKEVKEQINKKRINLYKLVNRFFIKYMLDDIENETVEKMKYSNKLNKLEKIQNFGIFTSKNLNILENKFIVPYLEEMEKRKREHQKKQIKILRQKIALEEFENYKKSLERKRKSQLIYDNSYLFKKTKQKEYKLRKEVEDILNKEYQDFERKQFSRSGERLNSLFGKRKKTIKRNKMNNYINPKLKKLQMLDEEEEEGINEKKLKKELEEQKEDELKDKKLKEFFEKIRKLKRGEFKDFDEELNQLINEIMDNKDIISKNKENRMNSFLQNFELNRMKNKAKDKFYNKGYNFVSPIRFISENNK